MLLEAMLISRYKLGNGYKLISLNIIMVQIGCNIINNIFFVPKLLDRAEREDYPEAL